MRGTVHVIVAATFPFVSARGADYVFRPVSGVDGNPRLAENWIPYGGPTGRGDRVVTPETAVSTGLQPGGRAAIPDGFELVWITHDSLMNGRLAMNDCGQVAFRKEITEGISQIFLYDNGIVTQITDDDPVANNLPDINNDGVLVWSHAADGFGNGYVARWENGQTEILWEGFAPEINDPGQLGWVVHLEEGCLLADANVFFFDGTWIRQITKGDHSNQGLEINDLGQLIWIRKDFCPFPNWTSTPRYNSGLATISLPSAQNQPQRAVINNQGLLAWGGELGIEAWIDGETQFLFDQRAYPSGINELGEIVFHRWDDPSDTWQVWLYRDGQATQLTDDPFWSYDAAINEFGEIALESGPIGLETDLRLIRRIRTGDFDFDGDVQLNDYAEFPTCMTGPFPTTRLCECRFFDIDHSAGVDLRDFTDIQNRLGP